MPSASLSQCMQKGCKAPPEHECIWAGGRGRAWFCDKHYGPWKKEADKGEDGSGGWLELVKERKVKGGEVGKRYGEEPAAKTAAPEKYSHIDFKPPESVANAAAKGLEYRQKASPSNRGGLTSEEAGKQGIGSGVQRAVNLKNRDTVSPETIRKMHGFFSRHEKNKGIAEEHKGTPWNDKGYVAWLLWGGDPGQAWAAKVMRQMETADEKAKGSKKASVPIGPSGERGGADYETALFTRGKGQQDLAAQETYMDPITRLAATWGPSLHRAKEEEAIPGGLAKGMKPSDFDPKELEVGTKIEREHLVNDGYSEAEMKAKAQEIAMDHLAEIPDYYTRLVKMEQEAEGKKASALTASWGDTIEEATRAPTNKKAKTYNRLVMFDFDGTLFRSWEATPSWWEGTELDTGPYSFAVQPESLDEPCVPDNPPSNYWIPRPLAAAKEALRDRGTLTVLITGRVKVHRQRVMELAQQKGLRFDKFYFNPGMSAARFKVAVLKNLLVGYNTITAVEIWENENQKTYDTAMRATARALADLRDGEIDVKVHHVHAPPKELVCGPEDFGLPSQNTPQEQPRFAAGVNFSVLSQIARQRPLPDTALSASAQRDARQLKERGLVEWDLGSRGWTPTREGLDALGRRASKTAAITGDGTGVGLFIPIPETLAHQFPSLEPYDDSPAHITFMYVGDIPADKQDHFLAVTKEAFAQIEGPVRAVLDGVDVFQHQDKRVAYSKVRFSQDLIQAHDHVRKHLEANGIHVAHSFPFLTPHATLAYMGPNQVWKGPAPQGAWACKGMQVWGLPKVVDIPFGEQTVNMPDDPELGARRFARLTEKRANAARLRSAWGPVPD